MNNVTVGDILKAKNIGGYIRVLNIVELRDKHSTEIIVVYRRVFENGNRKDLALKLSAFLELCDKIKFKRIKNIRKNKKG